MRPVAAVLGGPRHNPNAINAATPVISEPHLINANTGSAFADNSPGADGSGLGNARSVPGQT